MKLQKNFLLFLFLPFFMNQCNNNFSSEGEQTTTKPPPFRRFKMLSFQEDPAFSIPLEGKKEPKVAFAHLDSDNKKDLMIVSLEPEMSNTKNQIVLSSYLSTNQSSYVFQNKIQSVVTIKDGSFTRIKQIEVIDSFFKNSMIELHIIGDANIPNFSYAIIPLSQGAPDYFNNTGAFFMDGSINAFAFGEVCEKKQPQAIRISSPNFLAFMNKDHYGIAHPELANPIAISVADFTKDGNQDLLILNQENQNLVLLKGTGNASCYQTPKCTIALPKEVHLQNGLQVADFNQDGNMDIIISGYGSKNISILWGQGTDVFKTFTHIDTTESPLVIKVVDLDQDGKLDIIVATSKHIKILYPNGKIQTIASFELPLNISDLWVLDQNNDGKLDIWLEHMSYNKEVNRFIGDLSLWINQSK